MTAPALVWLRNDLRVSDNPALAMAAASQRPLIVLHVLEEGAGPRPLGAAARWWLHHSLVALGRELEAAGVALVLRRGDARIVVPGIAAEAGAAEIFWNDRHEPGGAAVDREIASRLATDGRKLTTAKANLLVSPDEMRTGTGGSYRVYTPFARAVRALGQPRLPLAAPDLAGRGAATVPAGDGLADWALLPTKPDWAREFGSVWTPGERGARQRLEAFVANGLARYRDGRDLPASGAVSMLSPHLRFGEISPYQVWHAVAGAAARDPALDGDADKYLSELLWREFCWHLLGNEPDIATRNIQGKFDAFGWRADAAALAAWQAGRTGYPFVDAGLRQLWRTGWMHNRVRMVAASFLVKHLMIDWRDGERWFWDTLVDADEANNPASWQWVVGSGADAAPYFRIFNPVTQGEKFDPDGAYLRRWLP